MRDIWIITNERLDKQGSHDLVFEVHHQQLEGSSWRDGGVMPFQEFVGSHKALSSFSMPDTLVYLALPPNAKPDSHTAQSWVAISDSPSRLIYADMRGEHLTLIEQVQAMGKEVIVCCLRPSQPQAMQDTLKDIFTLVSQNEMREIEKWHFKKAASHTVVNTDWTLGALLTLNGKESWLKSRLTMSVLIVTVASAAIHLALESLRTQKQHLALQHSQVIKESERNNRVVGKTTDWKWLAQTLSSIQLLNSKGTAAERLSLSWDATGTLQVMLKTENQDNSKKANSRAIQVPEGCKHARQGWMICTNNSPNQLAGELEKYRE